MLIEITPAHIDFVRANRIFLNSAGKFDGAWLKPGAKNYNTASRPMLERYSGQFSGPRFCTVGAFSYVKSYIAPSYISFGRYCAVAEKVRMIPSNHPTDRLSSCGFDYADAAPYNAYAIDHDITIPRNPANMPQRPAIVGNDVWIGEDVLIKRGVTIGHGAVIGTRTIVTKDVPPYATAVGAPVQVKGYRFDEATRERLLQSEWWNFALKDFAAMDTSDPVKFLDRFEEAKETGEIKPMENTKIDLHREFERISGF